MALSSSQIDSIARQMYSRFPEIRNSRPVIQDQPVAKSAADGARRYLLMFSSRGQGPGGKSIQRIVRVVADERGRVIKVSTSR